MIILKLIALFIGIWFTVINAVRLLGGASVGPINLLIQSISITIFLILQFNLY